MGAMSNEEEDILTLPRFKRTEEDVPTWEGRGYGGGERPFDHVGRKEGRHARLDRNCRWVGRDGIPHKPICTVGLSIVVARLGWD